jgi:hypothetical protein
MTDSMITFLEPNSASPEPVVSTSSPFIDPAGVSYEYQPVAQAQIDSFPKISGGGLHITMTSTIVIDIPLVTPPI